MGFPGKCQHHCHHRVLIWKQKCKNCGSRNPTWPLEQSSWVLVDTQLPRPPWPPAPCPLVTGTQRAAPAPACPLPCQWQVLYQPSCKEARMAPTCRPALSGLTCYRGQRGPCDRPSTFHFLLTLPLCCCDLTLSPCGHSASSTLHAAAWEFPEGPSPALPSCDPWAPWSPRGRRGPGSHRVWHGEPVRRLRVTPSSRRLLGTWRDRQGPPCPEHSRYQLILLQSHCRCLFSPESLYLLSLQKLFFKGEEKCRE